MTRWYLKKHFYGTSFSEVLLTKKKQSSHQRRGCGVKIRDWTSGNTVPSMWTTGKATRINEELFREFPSWLIS